MATIPNGELDLPAPVNPAARSIAPHELEGAALQALELVAGGASRAVIVSPVIDPTIGPVGYAPPEPPEMGPIAIKA